jgi:hypothetical protein
MWEKIQKNWKDGVIVFLVLIIAFLIWRGVNLAKEVIKAERELGFVYRQLIEEKLASPTIEDCSALYEIEEICPKIEIRKIEE